MAASIVLLTSVTLSACDLLLDPAETTVTPTTIEFELVTTVDTDAP
jgi:hypothetical protein